MVHGAMRMAPASPARGPTMQGGQALALAQGQMPVYATFDQVVALIREKRDMRLLMEVETSLKLAKYALGRIEFEPAANAAPDLAARLSQRLQTWTGERWGVSIVSTGGAATIAQERDRAEEDQRAEVMENPLVQAVIAAFPGAKISEIRTAAAMQASAAIEALPETDAAVITLFYYDELSLEEIAEVTGLTSGNIRIKLHRSRKKLYQVLSKELKSELNSIM